VPQWVDGGHGFPACTVWRLTSAAVKLSQASLVNGYSLNEWHNVNAFQLKVSTQIT
jgi:hypothetical protein